MDELIKKLIALIDERLEQREPQVYEIDLSKKYMIVLEDRLPYDAIGRIRQGMSDWLKSDEPFFVIHGVRGVKLVKVETDE